MKLEDKPVKEVLVLFCQEHENACLSHTHTHTDSIIPLIHIVTVYIMQIIPLTNNTHPTFYTYC